MRNRTASLMERKFNTMLLSGMIYVAIVAVVLMANTIIAGLMLGSAAVEAVTLVTPLYSLGAFFAMLVSMGFPILYSAAMGRMDRKEADQILGTGLVSAVLMGVLLFILLTIGGEFYFSVYHPSQTVHDLACEYLFWMRFSIICLPLVCLLNGAVYADGDELIFNVAGIVQMICSIVLAAALCRTLGIGGLGIGFSLAIIVSILISLGHLFRASNSLHLNIFFSWAILRRIFHYSLTDASNQLFAAVFTAVMNAFAVYCFGEDYLLLVSGVILVRQLQSFFDGVGQGAAPILSTFLGEENYAGVQRIYRRAERAAVIMGLVFTVIIFLAAPVVPWALGTQDQHIAQYLINGTRIISFSSVFVSLLYWHTSYYLIVNRILLSYVVTGIRDVGFSIPIACLLGLAAGPYGLFAGLMAAPFLGWIVTEVFLSHKYGNDYPLLLEDLREKHNSYLFSLEVCPEEIVRLRDEVGKVLFREHCSERMILRTKVLLEELFMLILEHNKNDVLGECVLNVGDQIEIIERDSGSHLDLTNLGTEKSSLREYLVSSMTEKVALEKHQMTALGFNRNRFLLPKQE